MINCRVFAIISSKFTVLSIRRQNTSNLLNIYLEKRHFKEKQIAAFREYLESRVSIRQSSEKRGSIKKERNYTDLLRKGLDMDKSKRY